MYKRQLQGPASFTIDPATVGDNTGTVIIAGNLQVDGTTTTINSTTLDVDDLNITVAKGAANAAAANGGGLTIDGANATLTYASASDDFVMNKGLIVDGDGSSSGVTVSDGALKLNVGGSTPAYIDFYCEVSNAHRVRLQSPAHANYSGNVQFTLPPSNGTSGYVLQTNGSGVTSWAAPYSDCLLYTSPSPRD